MDDDATRAIMAYRAQAAENEALRSQLAHLLDEHERLRARVAEVDDVESERLRLRDETRWLRDEAQQLRTQLREAFEAAAHASAHAAELTSAARSAARDELIADVREELRNELGVALAAELERRIRQKLERESAAEMLAAGHRLRLEFEQERVQLLARENAKRADAAALAAAQVRALGDAIVARDVRAVAEREARVGELASGLIERIAPSTRPRAPAAESEPRARRLLDTMGPRQRARLRRELLEEGEGAPADEAAPAVPAHTPAPARPPATPPPSAPAGASVAQLQSALEHERAARARLERIVAHFGAVATPARHEPEATRTGTFVARSAARVEHSAATPRTAAVRPGPYSAYVAALKARPHALATPSPQEALAAAEERIARFLQMTVGASHGS